MFDFDKLQDMIVECYSKYNSNPQFLILDQNSFNMFVHGIKEHTLYLDQSNKTLKVHGLTVCIAQTKYEIMEVR